MRARAEALGLCPGLTTGQWGCAGQVDTPRVVVSVARPELSSRRIHRKGPGRLGACESGWEAGVTLVPGPECHRQCSPQARGPLSPSLRLVPWVAQHHPSLPAVASRESAPWEGFSWWSQDWPHLRRRIGQVPGN